MEEKEALQENMEGKNMEKYLTFFVNNQCYGIPIALVIEIIGMQKVAEVPEFPYYAKGIINLRGLIIPLIDVNLRLGYEEQEYTSKTCVIVVNLDGMEVGLIVDEVDEVTDIDSEAINPPPHVSERSEDQYVSGVAVMEDRLILLMSCEQVIQGSQFEI